MTDTENWQALREWVGAQIRNTSNMNGFAHAKRQVYRKTLRVMDNLEWGILPGKLARARE